MNRERAKKALAAHADGLVGQAGEVEHVSLSGPEREELAPLFHLAERLQQGLQPVQPSPAFVQSLGRNLANSARQQEHQHQVVATDRTRRGVLIGAAAVGSLVSIASIVGAIVLVVSRLRAREHSAAHASMG